MMPKELMKIVELHKDWLDDKDNGERADLNNSDLIYADLFGADLRHATMFKANLHYAILYNANLRYTDFRDADLRAADLRNACMIDADMVNADLRGADLRDADLRDANLSGANLRGAKLYGTNLRGANLRDAKSVPFIPMACPDIGSFIGWKKVRSYDGKPCIVKLLIPEDAKRCSATDRKCRCDKAIVLEIQDMKTGKALEDIPAYSIHDKQFEYKVGKTVTPKLPFEEDRWKQCSSGIHFFINRQEAVEY